MKLARLFFFSFLLLCATMCVAPLWAQDASAYGSSELIEPNPTPGGVFPLQGVCARHGISQAAPGLDLKTSTWACHGASDKMLRIFYRKGPQECVYIDNFNNDGGTIKAFFVPLQTSEEWLAFKANLPGGVHMRFGCPGIIMKDACGNPFALPDTPASDAPEDAIRITTGGDYRAEYVCPYTLSGRVVMDHGCGTWQLKSEKGNCAGP